MEGIAVLGMLILGLGIFIRGMSQFFSAIFDIAMNILWQLKNHLVIMQEAKKRMDDETW